MLPRISIHPRADATLSPGIFFFCSPPNRHKKTILEPKNARKPSNESGFCSSFCNSDFVKTAVSRRILSKILPKSAKINNVMVNYCLSRLHAAADRLSARPVDGTPKAGHDSKPKAQPGHWHHADTSHADCRLRSRITRIPAEIPSLGKFMPRKKSPLPRGAFACMLTGK